MSEDKKSDYTEVHEEPRRMSEEDVKDYHGLTLNEQGEEYRKEAPQGGIHIEFIDVKAIPWWKKALYIAGIIAFLAIVLAVAWFFLVWGAVIFLAGVIDLAQLHKLFVLPEDTHHVLRAIAGAVVR